MPKITKFRGLRNTTTPDRFRVGELVTAENVDIDNTGRLQSRWGYTAVAALVGAHSIWGNGVTCLFVCNYVLYRLNADESYTAVKVLASNARMAYVSSPIGVVYYSNGVDKGRVVSGVYSCWGVDVPVGQPAAAQSAGVLAPGKYLYAMTFVRGSDLLEGGTGVSGEIELTTQGGIQFSGMEVSTNAELTYKRLYLSTTNGEVLYRIAMVSNGTTSFLYQGSSYDNIVPLETQLAGPPPAGTILDIYNGSTYVIVGNIAYQSDPYAYETFRIMEKFLQFPDAVTMFAGLNSSIWVSTISQVWHINGERSKESNASGAIPGTALKTTASILAKTDTTQGAGADEAGTTDAKIVLWTADRGIYAGYDTGEAHNLTETMYSFPDGQLGSAMVRSLRGYTQYLTSIQGTGSALNAA